MTITINASTSSGLVTTPDNSGAIALQNAGVTGLNIDASGRVTTPLQVRCWAYASATTNANIVYSNAPVNIGSAMNTSTGVFTCPVAGRYMFTAQGLANGGTTDITLNLNGSNKISGRATTQNTASIAIILNCAVNDQITIATSGSQLYGDSSGWSSFTGQLLG